MVKGSIRGVKDKLTWSYFMLVWVVIFSNFDLIFDVDGADLPFYPLLSMCISYFLIAVYFASLNKWRFIFQLWVGVAFMDIVDAIMGHFYSGWDEYAVAATVAALLTLTLTHYGKSRFSAFFKAVVLWCANVFGFSRI